MNRGIYPDNIYMNVRVQHSNNLTHKGTAKYEITKNQPLVYNIQNYYMSVVEGIIPMNTVPLFIARCIPDPGNPNRFNLMECEVGLVGKNGVAISNQSLIYEPQDRSARTPFVPYYDANGVLKNDYSTDYYYIYSIEHLLSIFNVAFEVCNAGLGAAAHIFAPYFVYDSNNQLIKLVFPPSMLNYPMATGVFDELPIPDPTPLSPIFINEASHEYLNGFNYYFANQNINQITYFFITNNRAVSLPCDRWGVYDSVLVPVAYYVSQEYYCLDTAYSVKRIIVTTDSIPVNQEFTSVFEGRTVSSANTQYPVILDLAPLSTKDNNVRQVKWVNEFGNNKLADLLSDLDLKRITIFFYFQDSFGNDHPLLISKYQNIFLKLAFQNKKLYLNE